MTLMRRNIKILLSSSMIKKPVLIEQINKDIQEYNGVRFSVGLSLQFFKDETDGTRKFFTGEKYGTKVQLLKLVILENFMMNT